MSERLPGHTICCSEGNTELKEHGSVRSEIFKIAASLGEINYKGEELQVETAWSPKTSIMRLKWSQERKWMLNK